MKERFIGTSGKHVFPLGLGCMGMSWGYAESGRDDASSVQVVREATDAGVQLIDTARVHGDGHNERLVGKAIADRRNGVLLASKGGLVVDDLRTKQMHRDGRPETLRRQVEEGLCHLGVDRIDLNYLTELCHHPASRPTTSARRPRDSHQRRSPKSGDQRRRRADRGRTCRIRCAGLARLALEPWRTHHPDPWHAPF